MEWLLVLDPEGTQFFAGVISVPDGLRRQVVVGGKAVLCVGEWGLDPTSPQVHEQQQPLKDAARQGRLLAATIAVIEHQA